jgi:Uma2 family endonuclease
MNATIITSPIATKEIFALPEDGIERYLVRGQLRVRPHRWRTRTNAETLTAVGQVLGNWNRTRGESKGEVAISDVGVRLCRDPETFVGIDATYYSAESLSQKPSKQRWYEGPPDLAIEILAPSTTHGEFVEKVTLYLECGVPVVWILDPDFQTLTVYRSKTDLLMLRVHETLDGHPELPGLTAPIRDFFN